MDQSSAANVLGSVSDLLDFLKDGAAIERTAAFALLFGLITQVHWRYGLGIYSGMFSSFLEIQVFGWKRSRCSFCCVGAAGCSQQDRLQLVRLNDKVLETHQKLAKLSIFFNPHTQTHTEILEKDTHVLSIYLFVCCGLTC